MNPKYLCMLLCALVLLSSCTKIPPARIDEHIGCSDGEIVDGKCVPSESNNVNMFMQDLSMVRNETGEFGYIAEPSAEGRYPGIIMIHEWWGLNDNIKQMAKILAKEGYVVYAVDLYDGRVAADSADAGKYAGEVRANPKKAIETMGNALKYLKARDKVIPESVGSIGWCFGGGQSLQLAIAENLDAAVIYYGQLVDDREKLANVKEPVLGIFGAEDKSIPVDSVNAFEAALNELGTESDIYIYPAVGHAFANPTGANYAPEQTIDAWEKTVEFLDSKLKE